MLASPTPRFCSPSRSAISLAVALQPSSASAPSTAERGPLERKPARLSADWACSSHSLTAAFMGERIGGLALPHAADLLAAAQVIALVGGALAAPASAVHAVLVVVHADDLVGARAAGDPVRARA